MKVVLFNGSPKSDGNTFEVLSAVAEVLEGEQIETEIIHVGNKLIRGCLGCNSCIKSRDERCIIDDEVNDWIQLMKEADGIVLGSPVYFAGVAGTMKCFLDRAFYVGSMNKMMFRGKVGASVAVVRRAGGLPAFDTLNHYINYSEMIMPGSNYWTVAYGTIKGEVQQDTEGIQTARILGRNMAWLLKTTHKEPFPSMERKAYTNFIR